MPRTATLERMTTTNTKPAPLTVHLDLDADVRGKLAALAEEQGRTVDSILADVVAQYFMPEFDDELEARLDADAEKGFEEIEAGKFVEHERVKEWAESLSTANPLPLPRPRSR